MSESKYSLAMIARGNASELDRCLASYHEYPDEIVVVNTAVSPDEKGWAELEDVIKKYGAKGYQFPWQDDFSKARTFSFEKCSNDYVLWLDADDTVVHAQRFDNNIRMGIANGCSWLTASYFYEWDKNGHCTTRLKRERVVDRRSFEWREPIHEALCATRRTMGGEIPERGGYVHHHQFREDVEKTQEKLKRNIGIFEGRYMDSHGPGARLMYYWGNTLVGLGRFDEAIEKYDEYLRMEDSKSGHWPVAQVSKAECYRLTNRPMEAFECAMKAIGFDPRMPSAWVQASEALMLIEDYDRALIFAQAALDLQDNAHLEMVNNPRTIQGRPHFIRAVGLAKQGKLGDAEVSAKKALEIFPDNEALAKVMQEVLNQRETEKRGQAFDFLKSSMEKEDAPVDTLKETLRPIMELDPSWNYDMPKRRKENLQSLALVCGPSSKNWGPDSIEDGIGGSEEAVINMAREMESRGWQVEVYCQRRDIERRGNVTWYPWNCWTGANDAPVDVAVWWRGARLPSQLGGNVRCNYLWLHDMPIPHDWVGNVYVKPSG